MREQNWDVGRVAARGQAITCVDTHAAGEPLRIVVGGLPEVEGATILERRRFFRERLDHIRRAIIYEPRGHYDMYGAVLTPPVSPEADLGVLFLHNQGYSTMCGHGVIALVTALFECGVKVPFGPMTPVALDTPAGLVRAVAYHGQNGRVDEVAFVNVPSFVYARDLVVDVAGWGLVTLDVAFGGAFYAILPAERLGLALHPSRRAALVEAATAVTGAVQAALAIAHPDDPDLGFLYGTILTGPPEDSGHHSRNLCVFADAEVDRSPTGTGVSARLALHHARGELSADEPFVVESIVGAKSTFGGRVVGETRVGAYAAIVPEVRGRGFVTGISRFVVDPDDALGAGFLL